jgi:hypothetical protein
LQAWTTAVPLPLSKIMGRKITMILLAKRNNGYIYRMKIALLSLAAFALLLYACFSNTSGSAKPSATLPQVPATDHPFAQVDTPPPYARLNGLTMVAPPKPFKTDPMLPVKTVGAEWIAVVPYAYTMIGRPEVRYGETNWQWWGETREGARKTILLAHEAGLKVMLKPQVYIPQGWPGMLDFQTDSDWAKWEAGYERYLLDMAQVAADTKAELLCFATEFNLAAKKRTFFWRQLIDKIRKIYPGPITYSSNWDDYANIPFWDQLDYIGLSAYFPLINANTPAIDSLKTAWEPYKSQLKAFSKVQNKPILFTEYGYLSVDNCGWRTWEMEQGVQERNINQQAQANCYDALFLTFAPEPWWAGGFLWKWFPEGQGHEGYPERDYTPQGKMAEQVLKKHYKQ